MIVNAPPHAPRNAVRDTVRTNARISSAYLIMNALGAVVASYGLLQDSVAVVIGAMVIATLLGPISGIALALVDGDSDLLRDSLAAEAAGVFVVLAVAWVVGRAYADVPLGQQILLRTSPNLMDLMIALAGGAAGAYATVSPRVAAGLVGVAIATALVPPLAVSGICFARGEGSLGLGSLLLFLANLVAVQFASSVVMMMLGYHQLTPRPQDTRALFRRQAVSLVLLIGLTVGLSYNLRRTLAHQHFERRVRAILTGELQSYHGAYLADLRIDRTGNNVVVTTVVRTPFSIRPDQVRTIQSKLPNKPGTSLSLHVRSVLTKEATSEGYLWLLPEPTPPEKAPAGPVPPPPGSPEGAGAGSAPAEAPSLPPPGT